MIAMTRTRHTRKNSMDVTRGLEPITRVVFGLRAQSAVEMLRARGYDVAIAANAEGARRLAVGQDGIAVVVPVAPEADGGLLATAKIVTALPDAKMILLVTARNERIEQFAEFIGATLAYDADGPESLVNAILF